MIPSDGCIQMRCPGLGESGWMNGKRKMKSSVAEVSAGNVSIRKAVADVGTEKMRSAVNKPSWRSCRTFKRRESHACSDAEALGVTVFHPGICIMREENQNQLPKKHGYLRYKQWKMRQPRK